MTAMFLFFFKSKTFGEWVLLGRAEHLAPTGLEVGVGDMEMPKNNSCTVPRCVRSKATCRPGSYVGR